MTLERGIRRIVFSLSLAAAEAGGWLAYDLRARNNWLGSRPKRCLTESTAEIRCSMRVSAITTPALNSSGRSAWSPPTT
jgi:hypothetical protein